MSVARQLYQLQEADLELESSEQALAQITSKLGESQRLLAARNEFTGEQQRLEQQRRQQHSVEWEIDEITTKLAAVEENLYSGRIKNPKELTSLQQETDGIKARRSRVEDRVLEIMEQVSAGEARVAALGSELGRLEVEWQNEQRRLSAEADHYRAIIAELKQKRQQLLDGIDPAAAGVYQKIRRQRSQAVARVEQGICRGCGISLSTAQLQQVRGESLVQCSNCGRVLFFA